MNQSSLLFWEVRTCQNPCAAAGVILWPTEPNQPEKSPAASLPGFLASLRGSHFCLEHNILLCQPSAENCCCCSVLLVEQSQKTHWTLLVPLLWREPALLMLPCSGISTKEEMHARNRCGCRNPFKQTVCWNQFFLLNQLGRQGSSHVLEKPWPFRAKRLCSFFGECQHTTLMALKLGGS